MSEKNENEELITIFIEEARDLLNTMSNTLQKWSTDLNNKAYFSELKRDLHTLKGGARMVGQSELSALAHELESLSEALIQNIIPIDKNIYDWICKGQDAMVSMVESIATKNPMGSAKDLINEYEQLIKHEKIEKPEEPQLKKKEVVEQPVVSDVIRVHSKLLEQLNDLSVENNVIRVNLGHQINTLRKNLQETNRIIKNVQNNKLSDMEKTLTQTCQSAEALLNQQRRISLQLQNSITETRLEPFQSIVPRLSRIVRQVALELNKKIDFVVPQSEGVMDRNLLEHLIPALEHLLRNAIDHGIELANLRIERKKPEIGKIAVKFSRVGNDALIEMSDDGAGIDPWVIRHKAIKMGLLEKDTSISDQEVIRYIFEPGFSTREAITEVSGRGVGMDVVNTVIKGMGGSITINSTPHVGTTMVVRFPFTTSMNRGLLFKVKDELYGMVLSNVHNISLLNNTEIHEKIMFDNQAYDIHYLGDLLFGKISKTTSKKSNPVLFIRALQHNIALVVDELKGSQEIFVQSLGPQFKLTELFSGAAMLADGQIVIILDVYALAKLAMSKKEGVKQAQPLSQKKSLVMVVDDSMTVRTVTKNFLEKHEYTVITAEDGQNALEILEKEKPDIILLDLEMPRMDGFTFAETLRKKENQSTHIPIIMITFRSGENEKKKALQLGIERFVAKPYQEDELLETITSLLSKKHE